MFVRRTIPWSWTLFFAWPSLIYFLAVALLTWECREWLHSHFYDIPTEPVSMLATALAIFLGFKNNEAYGRWWEARTVWGQAVNSSRSWSRQVLTLFSTRDPDHEPHLLDLQHRLIRRHIAFVHALRVYLRAVKSFPQEDSGDEPITADNDYRVCRSYLSIDDYRQMRRSPNPPEVLLQQQGRDLRTARDAEYLSDYLLAHVDQTLVELNNVQGKCERIKKTPLPRPYSYFQRVFVHVLGTLLPFTLLTQLSWMMIPVSVLLSFVFLTLDLIGSRTEDPFENRVDDVPLCSLTRTIERDMLEALGQSELPAPLEPIRGVLL